MVLDSLENCQKYYSLNRSFKEVFEFIKENDLNSLELGRHSLSEDVFMISEKIEAVTEKDAVLEAHKEYIDVQLCLSGVNQMGWCPLEKCDSLKEEHEDKDLYFYEGRSEALCTVSPGSFAIFFPEDGHAPNIGCGQLHKIIFKVKV